MSERRYIFLPVHNRRAVSVRLAEMLRGQTMTDFQLILIDDGSTDGTADAIKTVLPQTVVLRGDGTWWWAGCMAAACRWLEAQAIGDDAMIVLMNDDVEIEPTFLESAVREFSGMTNTLVLARQLDASSGLPIDAGGGVAVDLARLRFTASDDPATINCLPTRGLFLRWGDLRRTGGFRPTKLPHYFADYEFTLRAHRAGLHLRVAEQFSLRTHPGGAGARAALFQCSRTGRLKLLFSNRFKENPRAWLAFVWLASPPACRPWLTIKVVVSTMILVTKCLVVPTQGAGSS